MTTLSRIAYIAVAVATFAAASSAQTQQTAMKPDSSGYVAANGVEYWFQIHGKGEPLLLLHGGLMSSGAFGPTLTKLAEKAAVSANHRVGECDMSAFDAPFTDEGLELAERLSYDVFHDLLRCGVVDDSRGRVRVIQSVGLQRFGGLDLQCSASRT